MEKRRFKQGDEVESVGYLYHGKTYTILVTEDENDRCSFGGIVIRSDANERPIGYEDSGFASHMFVLIKDSYDKLFEALDQLEHGKT